MNNFKLCYVDGNFAYFTSQSLDKQWGDDWNDAPYEHNAGTPYLPSKEFSKPIFDEDKKISGWEKGSDYTDGKPNWEIIKVAFDGDFETPADIAGHNSSYSVEMINKKAIAWLTQRWSDTKVSIHAGATIHQFISLIELGGGTVYLNSDIAKELLNEQTKAS